MRCVTLSLLASALACCSYPAEKYTPLGTVADAALDTTADATPSISVGFAKATTLADEASNVVPIRVALSAPADITIEVLFASGGTATKLADYDVPNGMLTFAPGDVEEDIDVTVVVDGAEEPDETISFTLSSVSGGATLGNADHTMTIAASVLPRVSFTTTSTMNDENMSTQVDVTLDKVPLVSTSVHLSGTGTATGNGIDYTLSASTVTFAVGETTKQVNLSVDDDGLDEHDETVIITLDNPTNAILAAADTTRTHVIQDDDPTPTVTFAAGPSSSVTESIGMVDVIVQLSTPSGRDTMVAVSVGGTGTATSGTDYMLTTTSVMFPAGTTSKAIRVNVLQDAAVETSETVILSIDTLTDLTAGTDTVHTLTITDDDSTCLGTGTYAACFPTVSGVATVNSLFNTDSDARCMNPTIGWNGQPASCFITAATINITAVMTVTGSKPLVLFASGNINVSAHLDAASHRGGTSGPGTNLSCTNPTTFNGFGNATTGAAGGAGGSFRSAGGSGGSNGAGSAAVPPIGAVPAPTVLRGGCMGQLGGNPGGTRGAGGGGVYLVAGGTITIASGVAINVSGAGGSAPGVFGGGSGGGSGGMIKLVATAFSTNGARLMANGGGGSSGGDDNNGGANGSDPSMSLPTTPAPGATGIAGSRGGDGFAGTTQATAGTAGAGADAGGGGGGGGGHIVSNLTLAGATISAGP